MWRWTLQSSDILNSPRGIFIKNYHSCCLQLELPLALFLICPLYDTLYISCNMFSCNHFYSMAFRQHLYENNCHFFLPGSLGIPFWLSALESCFADVVFYNLSDNNNNNNNIVCVLQLQTDYPGCGLAGSGSRWQALWCHLCGHRSVFKLTLCPINLFSKLFGQVLAWIW